jgi:A/G-specific adenine glycosylase
MLQQTPVARVRPVWEEWLYRWPAAADLASSPAGDAVRAWARLGYPRRAIRLHAAASAIVSRHGGDVPADFDALMALPGIGRYTASAVASFAFGLRYAVVDTNVRRVQARAVTGEALPAPSLSAAETRLAEALLPADAAATARWNVAVMELGAVLCTARAPQCAACPLHDSCAWVADGRPPYAGPPRRQQRWEGTDRQIRGRMLARLRACPDPLPRATLLACAPDRGQADRCLLSLLADGLVDSQPGQRLSLPA